MSYPPQLSREHSSDLVSSVRDWQFQHGSLLKAPPRTGNVLARPIGVTLFPTLFPKDLFEEARELQRIYNKLYTAIAADETWLGEVLKDLIGIDPPVRILWEIYSKVKKEGYNQHLSLGIFRSDYMLHAQYDGEGKASSVQLKQVEFNTFSVAGGAHSNRISDMHRYLQKVGAYPLDSEITPTSLPQNPTIKSLASGLATAHTAYGTAKSNQTSITGIIFVVQPNNVNICDERPIEYELWEHGIPNYRVEFGTQLLDSITITPSQELLFHPASHPSSNPIEISIVYWRAGYEVSEYNNAGSEARFQIEKSKAIKCPSILSHIATFKKVQQALTTPRALEHFLSPEEATRVSETFVPLYPMDESELGMHGRSLAGDLDTAVNHILKPSLEGGGHNVYGGDIPAFLESVPESEWHTYILMELIESPMVNNTLVSPRGVHTGSVISELGIFGVCLWREGNEGVELLENWEAGFSFKTKARGVDEMSVVKGYGCFDSPCLV